MAGESQAAAVPALEQMMDGAENPAAPADCRTFAEEIIRRWKPRQRFAGGDSSCSARMLKLLEQVGTEELVGRFIREILPKDFDGSEGKPLHRLCRRFGWGSFAAALRKFVAQQQPEDHYARLKPIVSICVVLCCDPPALTDERRAVCASLADDLAQAIQRWDAGQTVAWCLQEEKRAGVVADVVRIYATISAAQRLDHFLAHVLADKRHYDLHEVLIPDVKAIHQSIPKVPAAQPAFSRLLQHCLTELLAATARPIEPPNDWTRDDELGCTCDDCRALGRFLRDPAQRVGRFPLRKDRRQHLHVQIDKHNCDLTHVTERAGSPQTLVCTKTQGTYERRLKQFDVDKTLLAELEAIAGGEQRNTAGRSPRRRTVRK